MRSERGFHRLVAFSDAVVAIAITLLILPLVDRASNINGGDVLTFFNENRFRLFAFTLSFVVIGSFWWGQHQAFERVKGYNTVFVLAIFVWLFSIVFLPFPTELLGSGKSNVPTHALYVGTMLLATVASFVAQWAVVRWPELQTEDHRGTATIDGALVSTILMALAFTGTIVLPALGMWCLLILLLQKPAERLAARGRARALA